jgi:hypothetical protein
MTIVFDERTVRMLFRATRRCAILGKAAVVTEGSREELAAGEVTHENLTA